MSVREASRAIPRPPPSATAKAAITRSASFASSGRRSPRRSASARTTSPCGAARSAADSASPLPRRGSRRTTAPAASASAAVPSSEPSSATITSAPGNSSRNARTVSPTRPSSSRAATRTATGSRRDRGSDRLHRRQDAVGRVDAVVAPLRLPGEEQRERQAPHARVDVVDRREVVEGRRTVTNGGSAPVSSTPTAGTAPSRPS